MVVQLLVLKLVSGVLERSQLHPLIGEHDAISNKTGNAPINNIFFIGLNLKIN